MQQYFKAFLRSLNMILIGFVSFDIMQYDWVWSCEINDGQYYGALYMEAGGCGWLGKKVPCTKKTLY